MPRVRSLSKVRIVSPQDVTRSQEQEANSLNDIEVRHLGHNPSELKQYQ